MRKRILIAGARGFLGSALGQFIRNKYPHYKVKGIDLRVSRSGPEIFHCDLNDAKRLKSILLRIEPDYIFNLAGGRLHSQKQLLSANFHATVSLLNVIGELDHLRPRIIIPGTAAEYGIPGPGVRRIGERTMPKPVSWYGFVKFLQTEASLLYARKGMDVTVVRMFNISGAGVPPNLAIGKFCQEIAKIEKGLARPVISTRNLDGKRDFLDVTDICAALWQVALHGQRGDIYNICSGRAYEIRGLLEDLLRYAKVRGIAVREEKDETSGSCDIIGANTKLKRLTRWEPRVTMAQSLKNSLEFYRKIL